MDTQLILQKFNTIEQIIFKTYPLTKNKILLIKIIKELGACYNLMNKNDKEIKKLSEILNKGVLEFSKKDSLFVMIEKGEFKKITLEEIKNHFKNCKKTFREKLTNDVN